MRAPVPDGGRLLRRHVQRDDVPGARLHRIGPHVATRVHADLPGDRVKFVVSPPGASPRRIRWPERTA
ncbi:MAG TPA: hypothetical protein VK012_05495 [Gemmatimonadales bacterium]|nr:hypothetical protein [Gemmatimonadales bacterium]